MRTRLVLCAACAIALCAHVAFPADATEPPPKIKAYLDAGKQQREAKIEELNARIKSLKADKKLKKQDRNKQILEAEKQLTAARAEKSTGGEMKFPLEVGAIGKLTNRDATIIQIEGPDEMLVHLIYTVMVHEPKLRGNPLVATPRKVTVLVRGMPTAGLADGKTVKLGAIAEVVGNYTSRSGSTYMAIAPFDESQLQPYFKQSSPGLSNKQPAASTAGTEEK